MSYVDRDDMLDQLHEHRDSSTRAPDPGECHGCLEVRPLMRVYSSECENCGEDVCAWCAQCCLEHSLRLECSLCECEITFTDGVPLCTRCEATARAHGKQMADAQRYPDPEDAA